jgi:FkbM family methyltransferase
VFAAFNSSLKRATPGLHHLLKLGACGMALPLPKMLWGRSVWTHPRLWNHVTWDKSVLEWLTAYLKPGDVFFDVGAHQGWLSMAAAWRTGSSGKVVAFEPSPILVKYLRYHRRMNGLAQVEIVSKAVTNTNSKSTPFILKGNGDSVLNSLVDIGEVEDGSRESSVIAVEAITLDSYSRQTGLVPSMIKIDAEGAEIWVCEGAQHLLAQSRPALIIATHPAWLPAGQKIEDLFALLSTYEYRVVSSDTLQYNRDEFRDYLLLAE